MPHTTDQQKWLDMRQAEREGRYYLCHGFKNMAVTMAGELVIGLTKNTKFWHYAAEYIEKDGVRITGLALEWDMQGNAKGSHANLSMDTVNKGVRVV